MADRRRELVAVVAVAIAATGFVGAAVAFDFLHAPVFDLDGEKTVPAVLTGLLLAGAAWAGFRAARQHDSRRILLLAAALGVMAFDETLVIHERLERWTGIGWQFLYLPVFAVAGLGWLTAVLLTRRLTGRFALLVGGAGAWVVAQMLELYEWRAGTEKLGQAAYEERLASTEYRLAMVPEEVLEMAGSALLLFGLLALAAAVPAATSGGRARRRSALAEATRESRI